MSDSNRPDSPSLSPRESKWKAQPAADENEDPITFRTPASVPQPNPAAFPEAIVQPAPAAGVVTAQVEQTPPAQPESLSAVAASTTDTSLPLVGPPRRTRRQEITVQFGSRMRVDVRDLLDEVAEREGITLRRALEQAIEYYAARA